MKRQNTSIWLGLLLFTAMIADCTVPAQSTGMLLPNDAVTPTITMTPMLTGTVTVPIPTNTSTAISTLPLQDASERLLDLLSNNGGCRLPCLWGITPGESTPQEAQTLWAPLSGISSNILTSRPLFTFDKGFVYPAYVEGDLMLKTEASYHSNNQVVSHIDFYAREQKKFVPSTGGWGLLSIFDSTTFGERVEYYSLAHLLSEQGVPTSVMIITSGPPQIYEGGGGFEIILSYPDKGIWVKYTTQQHIGASGKVRGCPANAHIEMELFPSGDAVSFYAVLGKTHAELSDGWYKPLEEATSMTLDQFYEIFRQPTDKCIETPANLWPTP